MRSLVHKPRREFPEEDLNDGTMVNAVLVELPMDLVHNTSGENEVLESLHLILKAVSRRQYVTERGYIGLCNKSVKARDQVNVLSAPQIPSILQPMGTKGVEAVNCSFFMEHTYLPYL